MVKKNNILDVEIIWKLAVHTEQQKKKWCNIDKARKEMALTDFQPTKTTTTTQQQQQQQQDRY